MSNNLLKCWYANVVPEDKRVIDVNALMAKRIAELGTQMDQPENRGFQEGFVEGLHAEHIGELLTDEENTGNVIKATEDLAAVREQARQEAEGILEDARAQAELILQEAMEQARQESNRQLEEARRQGYEDGQRKAAQEAQRQQSVMREREKQLEAEYQKQIDVLEPQFVDAITGIYEHIFNVDLQAHREILVHLITATMRKVEGARDFMIHVSKEDYPYVSMQKKQIMSVTAGNSTVEVIEDVTLGRNECLIETEGGIFDCGLGTQLTELRKKLLLLSYERQVTDY